MKSRLLRSPQVGALCGAFVITLGMALSTHAQCVDCPAHEPLPEAAPGYNLYWHHPCACVNEPCSPSTCATNMIPTWYASAEVLGLYRDETRDVIFQRNGTNGADVLRSDDFDIDFDAGTRLVLGRALGDWYRLEGTYYGSYGWSDTMAVRNADPITNPAQPGAGNLYSPFSNFGDPQGVVGTDFNAFASLDYESSFSNAEINLRRRIRLLAPHRYLDSTVYNHGEPYIFRDRAELSVLMGVRYINLDDRLTYQSQSNLPAGGTVNTVNWLTNNDMVGAQIGFLSQFLVLPRTWLDLEGKGGIFSNDIEVRSSFTRTNNAGAVTGTFEGVDQGDHTSFLGELSLHFNHQFTERMTVRLGYNAFWLVDVAIATQNFSNDINMTTAGPTQLQHRGDVLMHGPSLGLTWAF